eukprot:1197423-Rhodomonas_salina.1
MGHQSPKVLVMLLQSGEGYALGQGVCNVVHVLHLDKLQHPVLDQISEEVNASVDMSTPLAIHRILRHHDTLRVVFPDARRPMLLQSQVLE